MNKYYLSKLIRSIDLILSILIIILLIPLLFIVILTLFFTGEKKIFFIQERIGINNKPFFLYKFATMLEKSPYIGAGTITVPNDERVLPFGRFLRICKINELPQLINVIKGDMSFVGYRPLTKTSFDAYNNDVKNILSLSKPGLTGIGSIIFRNEEAILPRSNSAFNFYKENIAPYKGILETWYIHNMTIGNYFKIIALTIISLVILKPINVWLFFDNLPSPPEFLKKYLQHK